MSEQHAVQKRYHDRHAREFTFECGEEVLVMNLRDVPKWLPGRIIEYLWPVLYKMRVIWRHHVYQLLNYARPISKEPAPEDENN